MNKKLRIIGLSGTNGSGKDTVGHVLNENHGFLFVPTTELLRVELRRRHLPVTRKNLRMVSVEWRHELGLGVLVDKAVADFQVARDLYAGVVISSLRNPGEADRVHDLGGTVVWIDADPRIRYQRIQANSVSRGRAEEDNKTYDQFIAEEVAEMSPPKDGDDASLDMNAVKERSDIIIDNSKMDLQTFRKNIPKLLGL